MPELEPHYAKLTAEERPELARRPVHVVLDNLRSAFNVGSIFRTADAGAVEHLYLCGMTAHPPHPKLEKTALGAFEYLPWSYYERNRDCMDVLKEKNLPIIAIEVTPEAKDMHEFVWPQPVAIVLGNEVNGVNHRVLSRADDVVKIPMYGYKNSINVATAFGVVLYDILRQWKHR